MPETPDQKPAPEPAKALKSTLNLPQTAFAMKANLPVNEPIRLESWQKQDLYAQIRRASAGRPKYVLHDGPPYANGAIHLGHALNKCIKDFVVKTKTMAGFDAPYVPGWDCHGLPIEIKVDEQLGRKKLEMAPLAVRRACREYAQKYVDLQRSQFERIGVFGRWNDPYLTMSFKYEAAIAETFYDFFEKGFVYKGLKPVYWCIHDRTALAEAEVEYEQHTSPSVYVRYQLTSDPGAIAPELGAPSSPTASSSAKVGNEASQVYTIIWTTTPWTLPASLAVAFNPDLDYVALKCNESGCPTSGTSDVGSGAGTIYIVLADLAKQTAEACKLDATEIARFKGSALEHTTFQHPFLDRQVLGVVAPYVTAEQGTGAVHTAPAHGVDDFYTGKRYNLPEVQYVDNAGRHRHTAQHGGHTPQPYEDQTVFKSNPTIIEVLREKGALLSATEFQHSYPHCWRCHNPVIVRATEQWFIGMETPMPKPSEETGCPTSGPSDVGSATTETFRQRALNEIKKVKWDPSWGEERISNMIATRPDWCISRQRIWGVPIAVFLCEKCGTPLNDKAINKSIVELFKKEGADAWYIHEAPALLPKSTKCPCGHTEFRKEMDILDVWFESGASWHAVLEQEPDELRYPADLYTEGGDQHRGWFHSSLLCSVGMRGIAPYKMVATSGWTLDEQGRAFSKSLGNGVDPVDIAKRLGGEIVRLWVASVDFREDVAASENLMQRVSDNYRKLRNTLRFLLGNLHDFDPATNAIADFSKLEPLDQYILARLAQVTEKILKAYDEFEFHRAYHALNEFTNTDLSALYLDVLKDRLYTFAPNHPARRSAQTALWRIAESLTRLIAPILSFTADEVWALLPKVEGREPSVHLALFPAVAEIIPSSIKQIDEDWSILLRIRSQVLKDLEDRRQAKTIGKALEAAVRLNTSKDVSFYGKLLEHYEGALSELLGVSEVVLDEHSNPINKERREHEFESGPVSDDALRWAVQSTAEPAKGTKCERCWRYTSDVGKEEKYPTVCLRCAEALTAIHFAPYSATQPTETTT